MKLYASLHAYAEIVWIPKYDVPTAYILLNSKPDSEVEIILKIKEIIKDSQSAKCEIQGVYGVYDIIAKVECENMDEIRNTLGKIRRVNQIVSTITMLVNEEQQF